MKRLVFVLFLTSFTFFVTLTSISAITFDGSSAVISQDSTDDSMDEYPDEEPAPDSSESEDTDS